MVRVLKPQSWYKLHKRRLFIFGAIGIVVLAAVLWHFFAPVPNPLPPGIKKQVTFKVVYPDSGVAQINSNTWKYDSSESVLTYQIQGSNYTAIVSEQEVPLQYVDDEAAYEQFLGSLRPYANFNVPLGGVTLANFVTSGDLSPTGLAGIMKTHGTLIIIHPADQLSEDEWQALFKSLKVSS